jgi:hypothetical protein
MTLHRGIRIGFTAFSIGVPAATAAAAQDCPTGSGASTFFQRLSTLCAAAPAGAAAATPEAAAVLRYCADQTLPDFAAADENTRQDLLERAAAELLVPAPHLGPRERAVSERALPALLTHVSSSSLGEQASSGPIGTLLAGELLTVLCEDPELNTLFQTTCAGTAPTTLDAIRSRYLVDLAGLALRATQRDPSDSRSREFAVVAATLSTLARGASARTLAATLVGETDCAPGPGVPASGPAHADVALGGTLLFALIRDGVPPSDATYHATVVERLLREHGKLGSHGMSPERVRAVRAAVEELRALELLGQHPPAAPPADLEGPWLRLVRLAHLLDGIVSDRPSVVSPETTALVTALARRDVPKATEASLALTGTALGLDERARSVLAVAARVVSARDEQEAKRALASLFAPAWVGGLILDANGGVPVLSSGEFRVDANGTLGYEADHFGGWLAGANSSYFADLGQRELLEAEVNLEAAGWYNFQAPTEPFGLSLGLGLGLDQYLSQLTVLDATGTTDDETSRVFRGNVELGFWKYLSPTLLLRMKGQAGLHQEQYSQEFIVAAGGDAGGTAQELSATSGNYRAGGLLSWRAVEGVLRTSLLARGSFLTLTRSQTNFVYDFSGGLSFDEQNALSSARRLGLLVRLMADFELLEVANLIRPGVYAQLQHVRLDDGQTVVAYNVPSFGIGLRSYLPY